MPLEVRVLGPLEIIKDGAPVELPASKKTRALLGYLAATARPHARDRLTALLFESTDDPRGNLRWSLSKLRGSLGDKLVAERDAVAFVAGADASVDLARVRAAVTGNKVEAMVATVGECRGALLEGLELPDDYAFDQWLTEARHEVNNLKRKLFAAVVERAGAEDALPAARAWVALDPTDETAQASVVRLLVKLGRAGEAESQAAIADRRLRAAHPGKFLGELEAARRTSVPLRPLPPASSRDAPSPTSAPPLLGRAAEIASIDLALDDPRLLLFAGPAGAGRTRLLDRVAEKITASGGVALRASAHRSEKARDYGVFKDAFRALPAMGRPDLRDEEAVLASLADMAQARRIALLVDDLQWIDPASAGLLHFVMRAERPAGLLIAATLLVPTDDGAGERLARDLARKTNKVEVGPLDRAASLALVSSIDPGLDGAALYTRSQGLPRLLLSMAEAKKKGEATMTPTVEAMAAAPLEGLDPVSQELASWAAVLGNPVTVDDLARLSGLAPAALSAALGALEAQGILASSGAGYAFTHEMFRYSAYRQLSEPRRKIAEAAVAALRGI